MSRPLPDTSQTTFAEPPEARRLGVTSSAAIEPEYGVTDRLSASLGVPYVFAKYTGKMPRLLGSPSTRVGAGTRRSKTFR